MLHVPGKDLVIQQLEAVSPGFVHDESDQTLPRRLLSTVMSGRATSTRACGLLQPPCVMVPNRRRSPPWEMHVVVPDRRRLPPWESKGGLVFWCLWRSRGRLMRWRRRPLSLVTTLSRRRRSSSSTTTVRDLLALDSVGRRSFRHFIIVGFPHILQDQHAIVFHTRTYALIL
uniref:Uncharacterized protein n=1 Tax=Aegilops tauschii subsp. strangulata TaxID=200361 RepID=A0A453TCM9_AEGTS